MAIGDERTRARGDAVGACGMCVLSTTSSGGGRSEWAFARRDAKRGVNQAPLGLRAAQQRAPANPLDLGE